MDIKTIQLKGQIAGRTLAEPMASKFSALYDEWLLVTKQKLIVTSAYRSVATQQKLYDAYLLRKKKPPAVAKPGLSRHNAGMAIDVNLKTIDQTLTWGGGKLTQNDATRRSEPYKLFLGIAGKHGFINFAKEAWHFSDTGH